MDGGVIATYLMAGATFILAGATFWMAWKNRALIMANEQLVKQNRALILKDAIVELIVEVVRPIEEKVEAYLPLFERKHFWRKGETVLMPPYAADGWLKSFKFFSGIYWTPEDQYSIKEAANSRLYLELEQRLSVNEKETKELIFKIEKYERDQSAFAHVDIYFFAARDILLTEKFNETIKKLTRNIGQQLGFSISSGYLVHSNRLIDR